MTAELANAYNADRSSSAQGWAIYGATGVTGRMVLERALALGHRPTLIGRDQKRLTAAAASHDLRTCVADIDSPDALRAAIRGHRLVLNAAGPFKHTGKPLVQAAIAEGVDHLDLNGELDALEALFAQDELARAHGVALVGGAGFGVAAADGLAAQAVARLGGADWIRLSIATDSAFNSGAVAESTMGVLSGGGFEVHGGRLVRRTLAARRWTKKGLDGKRVAFASVPLAELAAVRRASGAKRIVAGVPMPSAQAVVLSVIAPVLPLLLKIPLVRAQMAGAGGHAAGAVARIDHTSRVWVEAGRGRHRIRGRLDAGEGFAVAADIAVCAVEAALAQRPTPGAHSPTTAFGADFIARIPGVQITFES